MSNTKSNASNSAWDAIESEKKRDRFIRTVCKAAWAVTGVFAVLFAILVGIQVAQFAKGALDGTVPWMVVAGVAMPFVLSLGMLAVLIATVTTIGIFVRMRTASLHEIQLRLAALEDMLASQGGTTA
jgi:ABC-type dipeptide/oligopeptide/nickel transport system permease component